ALSLDPLFSWAQNDLGAAYVVKALGDELRGVDPTGSLERVIVLSQRAASAAPGLLPAHANEATAHLLLAEYFLDTGRDPSGPIERGRGVIARIRSMSPDWPWRDFFLAETERIEAEHTLATGGDPSAALDRGVALSAEHVRSAPASPDGYEELGRLAVTR